MKRSEVLLKLQRYYSIKHCMVESGHITKDEFMDHVLQLVEELGMVPDCVCSEQYTLDMRLKENKKKRITHYHPEECSYGWEPE